MIAALLLTISVAAMGQFAWYYWRAIVADVAARPVSDRVRVAAGLSACSVGSADFQAVLNLHDLTPELKNSSVGLRVMRTYYRVVERVGRFVPRLAPWTEREMTLCTRYVAALVDQRLERNVVCATEIRSC